MSTNVLSAQLRTPDFWVAVSRAVTWRVVFATQLLAALFALAPWLDQWGQRTQPNLPLSLVQQAFAAVFLMLAALGADEAVRRGWTVLRAFAAALLCACGAAALTRWGINQLLTFEHPGHELGDALDSFFDMGSTWGTVLLVYLNRQSAARLLASIRSSELGRAQDEHRLIASDVAAVEAQLDPAAVSRQLEQLRDLYASDNPDAEATLEALIINLRDKVAQCARAS
jgi:hypothetical protein